MNLCSISFTWPEDVRGLLRMSQGSWHLSLAALTVNVASNIGAPQWSSYCSIPIKQKLREQTKHLSLDNMCRSKVTPKLLDYTIVYKAWNQWHCIEYVLCSSDMGNNTRYERRSVSWRATPSWSLHYRHVQTKSSQHVPQWVPVGFCDQ